MENFLKVSLLILACFAILIWQQPVALFGVANLLERAAGRVVRWLRIRAASKADAITTYRRALAWHSSQM